MSFLGKTPKNMLPQANDRISFIYVEKARLEQCKKYSDIYVNKQEETA